MHYNFEELSDDIVLDLSSSENNGVVHGGAGIIEKDLYGSLQINTTLLDSDTPSISGTGSIANIEVKLLQLGSSTISFNGNDVFIDPDNNDIIILEKVNGLVELE